MQTSGLGRRAVLVAGGTGLGALLGGCASTAALRPIPGGEAVAVIVDVPAGAAETPIRNLAVGSGVAGGVGTGGVAGGLWGLVCGPFAVFCVPVGAVAGMASGAAVGALVGVTGALPDDKAALLRARLVRVRQGHDLQEELRRNVAERAQRFWRIDPEQPTTTIALELQEIVMTSTRDENIGLVMHVLVTVHAGRPAAGARGGRQKRYELAGPASQLAVWLDERNDFFDTGFSSAIQQMAAQIVAELAPG